jgi:hypothetical protein
MAKWPLEKCKEIALNYNTQSEWSKSHSASYQAAWGNDWLILCCGHMSIRRNKWTIQKCKEIASKYSKISEWQKKDEASYRYAQRRGWFNQCCPHIDIKRIRWTFEECKEMAAKFNTRSEWDEYNPSCYNAANHNGWLDECTSHMEIKRKKPSLDFCKSEALKYNMIIEWVNGNNDSYMSAHRHGWIEKCIGHMKRKGGKSKEEKELTAAIKINFPSVISKFFKSNPEKFIQKRFQIDIYDPNLNIGIEFNGTYWHSLEGLKRSRKHLTDDQIKNYHNYKRSFFASIGIQYLEINESDWLKDKQACIDRAINYLQAEKDRQDATNTLFNRLYFLS